MKIGIMSDTHDNLINLERAINILEQNKINLIIHAGDFVAPFLTNRLFPKFKIIGVFGNNDGEKNGIISSAKKYNCEISNAPYSIELASRKICIVHNLDDLNKTDVSKYDLVIFGHTHKKETFIKNNTLFINPGDAGGWITDPTLAIIDLTSMKYNFFNI